MTKKRSRSRQNKGTSLTLRLRVGLLGIVVVTALAFGLLRQNEPEHLLDDSGQLAIAAEIGALWKNNLHRHY